MPTALPFPTPATPMGKTMLVPEEENLALEPDLPGNKVGLLSVGEIEGSDNLQIFSLVKTHIIEPDGTDFNIVDCMRPFLLQFEHDKGCRVPVALFRADLANRALNCPFAVHVVKARGFLTD